MKPVTPTLMAALLLVAFGAVLLRGGEPGRAAAGEGLFAPPLGFADGAVYGPRELRAGGKLIEDTRFGVRNPDLPGSTCFGVAWTELYHAGQDLYRTDGKSTAGAGVTAVADGEVVYANPDLNYPGLVVILRHDLGENDAVYSVYAHLDDNSLEVTEGQKVKQGERLAEVMYQAYTGRYPEHHPGGDDSHLHFELRRFFNARSIYRDHPACNGLVAGRGYTYPMEPHLFPTEAQGYLNPVQHRVVNR